MKPCLELEINYVKQPENDLTLFHTVVFLAITFFRTMVWFLQDRLQGESEFSKTQEILEQGMYEGLKFLEKN